MTELEVVRTSIEANLDDLHVQRWALQAEGLRQATNTPDAEKTAAMRALDDQHDIRDQPETSRAALMWNAIVAIAARISPASQPIAKLEQADSVL